MIYMGGKTRLVKYILPIILSNAKIDQLYVEPFCGGCNVIDKVNLKKKLANDINYYLIELWKALQKGWVPPDYFSVEQYHEIKNNKEKYDPALVGYIGFNCFAGKFFRGYPYPTKKRNYILEYKNNILKQIDNIQGIKFTNLNYYDVPLEKNSLIYCDPPYRNTEKYHNKDFDHDAFWQWCRDMKKEGHDIFISEYSAPEDFKCIFEKEIFCTLANKDTKNKVRIEKIFTL